MKKEPNTNGKSFDSALKQFYSHVELVREARDAHDHAEEEG